MRFETIPAGESRQLNGPWFGLRVLVAGQGCALEVDRVALPVPETLPALEREIDTIRATGPITFVLADGQDERIGQITATPRPPSADPYRWIVPVVVAAGAYGLGAVLAAFTRPAGADSFALVQVSGDRPAWLLEHTYTSGGTWNQSGAALTSTPCAYVTFNPCDGRLIVGAGIGVVATAGAQPWPTPDVIRFKANAAFNPVTPPLLLGMWWRSGGAA